MVRTDLFQTFTKAAFTAERTTESKTGENIYWMPFQARHRVKTPTQAKAWVSSQGLPPSSRRRFAMARP